MRNRFTCDISPPHAASGWRIHCGVEVTELSTHKQHTLSRASVRSKPPERAMIDSPSWMKAKGDVSQQHERRRAPPAHSCLEPEAAEEDEHKLLRPRNMGIG
jgi:hypothetical protein